MIDRLPQVSLATITTNTAVFTLCTSSRTRTAAVGSVADNGEELLQQRRATDAMVCKQENEALKRRQEGRQAEIAQWETLVLNRRRSQEYFINI